MKLLRVVTAFTETAWAMLPARLEAAAAILQARANGVRAMEDDEPIAAAAPRQQYQMVGQKSQVAVIPVIGVISQRASMMDDICGGTSTQRIAEAFSAALSDPAIEAIVFDIDSPGGSVYGLPELADMVRAARGQKPMVAVSNSLAASAAYWLATQADEVMVTPSGEVGSVGVYAVHMDQSGALAEAGLKPTMISAGKYKTEGNSYEPLSDDARAAMQARVDDYYSMFVRAVAKGRGVSVDDVRAGFGQGRVYGAQQAVSERMADAVGTLQDGIRRAAALARAKAPAGGKSLAAARLDLARV